MSRQTSAMDVFALFDPIQLPQVPTQQAVVGTLQPPPTISLTGPTIAPWAVQGYGSISAATHTQAQHAVAQAPIVPAPVQPTIPAIPIFFSFPGPTASGTHSAPSPSVRAPLPLGVHHTSLKHFSLPRATGSVIAGQNLQTFTCFRRLPNELRHMIWKLAVPNRILTVFHRYKDQEDGTRKRMIAVSQPLRTLSLVCSESNKITAKLYKTINLPYMGWPLTFAPTADTLYFKTPDPSISTAAPGTAPSVGFGGPQFPSVKKITNDIVHLGFAVPSVAFDFEAVLQIRHKTSLIRREEVFIVVGQAAKQTRVKVLEPGVKFDGGKGKWGKGKAYDLASRAWKLGLLTKDLGKLLTKKRYVKLGLEMPEIKLIVLCEKEVGVPQRRVAPNGRV